MFFIMSSAVKMTELCVCPSSCQNVSPSGPVRFIRDHHSEWADFNGDAYSAASLKAGSYAYPGMRLTWFAGIQIIMLFGHTIGHEGVCHWIVFCPSLFKYYYNDENLTVACSSYQMCILQHNYSKLFYYFYFWCFQLLEVIRLEGHSLEQEDAFEPRDVHLLQVIFVLLCFCQFLCCPFWIK